LVYNVDIPMPDPVYLGEFEQLVLLAILRQGARADGVGIARALECQADRRVSRGALYTTLDRLEDKGLVRWKLAAGSPARGGLPRRAYAVTPRGVAALRAAARAFRRLSRGLAGILKEPSP
jgi:DNA-binding PadR family transcriptional regulator